MSIKRRKTEEVRQSTLADGSTIDCVVWELVDGDEVIGSAVANYKSRTQRTWDAEASVDGVDASIEGAFSITQAVTAIEGQLAAANTADAADDADANIEITEAADATA